MGFTIHNIYIYMYIRVSIEQCVNVPCCGSVSYKIFLYGGIAIIGRNRGGGGGSFSSHGIIIL